MVFTGTYEHIIDAKHRLAIPADIRSQVQSESNASSNGPGPVGVFYVTPGEDQALYLYTQLGFEQRAQDVIDSNAEVEELLTYERMWFSLARRLELDSAGRITLPDALIKGAGLGSEVVLLGVNDHMEVRDRHTWKEYVRQVLTEQPKILKNPRRVIRK